MTNNEHPYNALPSGYQLQEYELVRVLGVGGFGMTYLALDDNLNKGFAIKEYLPSDLATRNADHSVTPQARESHDDFQWGLERFVDEARTLARFDHRHIVKVHRYFEAHGTAYIVMEYAEGETLAAYLKRKGTLEEAELTELLYPLLDGLAVVHGADLLHRDIKPANIVIRAEDDSPVLLDFGAARQAIGERSRSLTSILTPGYAPIEQYPGGSLQGAWTDLYALGAVCYQALTGQVPVAATARTRDDPLVPVSRRCGGRVSRGFLSAIDGALAVYAEDRLQSVAAWREALEASVEPQTRRQAKREQRREQAAVAQERKAEVARREQAAVALEKQRREHRERQVEQTEKARLNVHNVHWIPGVGAVVTLLVLGLIRLAGIVTADWSTVFVGGIFMSAGTGIFAFIFTVWLYDWWCNDHNEISLLLWLIFFSVPLFSAGIFIIAAQITVALYVVVIWAILWTGFLYFQWKLYQHLRK